jgi:hypothetical protein
MKAKGLLCLAVAAIIASCSSHQLNKMDLTGEWQFTTDSTQWNSHISLPGSMTSNGLGDDITVSTPWTGQIVDRSYFNDSSFAKYREPGNIKVPFWLQPVKYYKGKAWYRKEVSIPASWKGQDIALFLERCHWETRLWIDGKEVGMQNGLSTPHRYDLTDKLPVGKHTLTLCIDNRVKDIDPGQNSHSISDHTQGNWNGVVGKMFLEVKPAVNIKRVQTFPDVTNRMVMARVFVMNGTSSKAATTINVKVGDKDTTKEVEVNPGNNIVDVTLPLGSNVKLWDEFHPYVYTMTVELKDKATGKKDFTQTAFGMREIKVIDKHITINGRPVFMRGTLDCAAFPKTGFPPTDKASWMKIYKTCRSFGLNHVRYHSWCPPEAAFEAADEVGIYLDIECSSWCQHLGEGQPIDKFLYDESERMVNEFGNHPSFCMLKYGNEPSGKGYGEYLSKFVNYWKGKDNRRLYCSSSGWPNLPENEYFSDPSPRIQGWGQGLNSIINGQAPRTDYDWSSYTDKQAKPVISHEIGQWCVYPNFKEIKKYDGVMRPKNLEIFQQSLKDNGMEALADSFLMASGKLQTLCYKADIEAALRTKGFGGFQLLGLNDFPGQGTALVGSLDAFWEEKGYVGPQEYSRFCNAIVPLLRLPKLIYNNDEILKGEAEVANFSESALKDCSSLWTLSDKRGKVLANGHFANRDIAVGNGIKLGEISIPLQQITSPQQLVLEVKVGNRTNSWNIWVYPAKDQNVDSKITMVDQLDDATWAKLKEGASVLLSLKKGTLPAKWGGDIRVGFSSIFWNTAWTNKQPPHTLGILCNPSHPTLKEFPTDYYSDFQWWDAMSHSNVIEIAKISKDIKPIVRVIDDWFTNRPLALLFEVKVGKGKLLVSGIDFWTDMDKRPAARQLLYSLHQYMESKDFQPSVPIVDTLFRH